jgi:hypothetical protein
VTEQIEQEAKIFCCTEIQSLEAAVKLGSNLGLTVGHS